MDRMTPAHQALDALVRRFGGAFRPERTPSVETALITDAEHGQYGILRLGWQPDGRRTFNTVFMARVKDGKVWIEADNTDLAVADELLKAGVRREDIVLGSVHPAERQYSDFAVA